MGQILRAASKKGRGGERGSIFFTRRESSTGKTGIERKKRKKKEEKSKNDKLLPVLISLKTRKGGAGVFKRRGGERF